ncbi:hypothetical protein J4464_06130 [Candidatus Woesearchaeota archaeon]|nr:hypothetical protein [Candidatus Woesearchaeota archaeon]
MRNKKAISPIIASVILIAITIALGAILISVARNYISAQEKGLDEKGARVQCATDVEFEFVKNASGAIACRDSTSGNIKVVVQNGPFKDVSAFAFTLIKTDGTVTTLNTLVTQAPLLKGGIDDYEIVNTAAISSISQIKAIPEVQWEGQAGPVACAEAEEIIYGAELKDGCPT